ncbi:MAG: murein hydrolase activator EnvC family protein [Desulfobulbus sp.]|jgi:septal ring factor EnvC (AmiA/AmiB activator)
MKPAAILLPMLVLTLACAVPAGAKTVTPQTKALNVSKLRFEQQMQEEKLADSTREEASLLGELRRLDELIAATQNKINTLRDDLRAQQLLIAIKEEECAKIAGENARLRKHLAERLWIFYQHNPGSLLNIAFSARNLPELLLAEDGLRTLVTYDKALFQEYRAGLEALEEAKRAQELECVVLENFLTATAREEAALARSAEEKNQLLHEARTRKHLHTQAIKEIRAAEKKLASTLKVTTKKQTEQTGPLNFEAGKGTFEPPIWGTLTRTFRKPRADDDPAFANGISIKPPKPGDVFAIAAGTVLFAGYMEGYGNLVILDHGRDYVTVTAGLDRITVRENESVSQGQHIGASGTTGIAAEDGLYFEIRHDTEPDDPMLWLRPGSLPIP